MKGEKKNRLTLILVGVIIVLVVALLYFLVLQPVITGNAVKLRSEGYIYAVGAIMEQAVQCQTIPLTYGNQTVNLIAVECLQQAQEQTQE